MSAVSRKDSWEKSTKTPSAQKEQGALVGREALRCATRDIQLMTRPWQSETLSY